jgi:hypothetical protein
VNPWEIEWQGEGAPPAAQPAAQPVAPWEMQYQAPPATSAASAVGQLGAGFNTGVARAVGGVLDLPGGAARLAGRAVGVPEQYLPKPDFFANAIQGGFDATLGQMPAPQTTAEHVMHGAGRGIADAASVFMPATAIRQGAQLGQMGQHIAGALAQAPAMQAASGAVGGGVGEGTGNPLLGLGAAAATPLALNAAGSIFGRVVSPVRPSADPESQRLLDVARREGIADHLTPGQMSESEWLRRFETVQRVIPFNGPTARNEGLQGAYNAAALRRGGVDATKADPAALDDMLRTSGQRVGSYYDRNNLNINVLDPTGRQNLQEIAAPVREAQRLAVGTNAEDVIKQYGAVMDKVQNGGVIEGRAVQNLRTRLKEVADGLETSNKDLSDYLRDMRKAVTDGMGRSMVAADEEGWREANRLHANLEVIRGAVQRNTSPGAHGDITPSALTASLQQSVGRREYATGAGDLNDIARLGRVFVDKGINDSGTAQNSVMARLATGGTLSSAAAGYASIDPLTAAIGLGGAMAPSTLYRLGMASGYLNPREAPQLTQHITPELLASVLAARGRAVSAGPSQQPQPAPNAALPAALLTR